MMVRRARRKGERNALKEEMELMELLHSDSLIMYQ